MTLTLDDASANPQLETLPVVVKPGEEAQERARKAVAGWRYKYKVLRADGSIELTFARRKLVSREVEA